MADLCCCEYYDFKGEKNHILACCCDCQDLDESFEGLISRKGVSEHNKKGMVLSIMDRLRIPWFGGAKQVTLDVTIAVISLPALIFLSAISFESSIIVVIATALLLIFMYKYGTNYLPKFFFWWTVTSVITLYVIFEMVVIPVLLIEQHENIIDSLFMVSFIFFYFKTRVSYRKDGIINKISDQANFCNLCNVHDGFHRYWIDSCITSNNVKYYCGALISAFAALIYTAQMTLTAVCHPFEFLLLFGIQLPDDCSQVYQLLELGLSFVSASYCIFLSVFMLYELLLITLNVCRIRKIRNRTVLFNCFNFLCSFLGRCK